MEIKEAIANINGLVSDFRPDNLNYFFRNLITARKLQTLGNYTKAKSGGNKQSHVFGFGLGHEGINDLLTLGPEVTLAGFSFYTDAFLRKVVNTNGGIQQFCKIRLVPVAETLLDQSDQRKFITDYELGDYLRSRLGETT